MHPICIPWTFHQERSQLHQERALTPYNYALDGDVQFDSKKARKQRERVRRHDAVSKWLAVYWRTCRVALGPAGFGRDQYFKYHGLLSRVLHKAIDAKGMEDMAAKDWGTDINHSNLIGLDSEGFERSMFEVADLWTTSIQPEEYTHFLATIYHRITRVKTWVSRTGMVTSKYVDVPLPLRLSLSIV